MASELSHVIDPDLEQDLERSGSSISMLQSKNVDSVVVDISSSSSNAKQNASNSYYTPPLTVDQNRSLTNRQKILDESDTPSRSQHAISSRFSPEDVESSKEIGLSFQAPISPRPSTPIRGPTEEWKQSAPDEECSPTTEQFLGVDAATPVFSEGASSRGSSRHSTRTPQQRGSRKNREHCTPPNAPKFENVLLQFGMGPVIEDQSSPTTHTKGAARRRKLLQEQLERMEQLKQRQIQNAGRNDLEVSPPKKKTIAVRTVPQVEPDSPYAYFSDEEGEEEDISEEEMVTDEDELGSDDDTGEIDKGKAFKNDTIIDSDEAIGVVEHPSTARVAQLETENTTLKARVLKLEKRMNSIVDILSQVVEQCDSFDKQLAPLQVHQDLGPSDIDEYGNENGDEEDEHEHDEVKEDEDEEDDNELVETDIENVENLEPRQRQRRLVSMPARSKRSKSERGPFEDVPLENVYSPDTLDKFGPSTGKRRGSGLEFSMTQSFRLQKKLRLHSDHDDDI